MPVPYNRIECAKYMLALANDKKKVLNQTKLQKLLFIAYGKWLCQHNGEQLFDETAKLWPFGPVFPSIQKKVKIDEIYSVNNLPFENLKADKEVTELFSNVIDKYSHFTAGQLSDWSHSEGSPWDITYKKVGEKWNTTIDNSIIQKYFCEVNV